jgi:hypothetical protein
MSTDDLWIALRLGVLPVAVVIIFGAMLVYFSSRLLARINIKGQLVFIMAFGSLGGLLGYSAGSSKQSIIGTVLPTLLTLVTLLLG